MFASGAINSWRLDLFVDVLFRHDTMFHGEDLQLALNLHGLRGKRWVLQSRAHTVHTLSYKVDVFEVAVTSTDVPVHWFHADDLWWPKALIKYGARTGQELD